MKVYCVFQSSGSYDTYFYRLIKIFDSYTKALKFKKKTDKECCINNNDDDIFTIIPKDIFEDWPYDEETFEDEPSYKGYTLKQYNLQDKRLQNAYMEYGECDIKEMEVE